MAESIPSILNAELIYNNIGKTSDCTMDIFDENLLAKYHCQALELKKLPVKCAVSYSHPLAKKERLCTEDLQGYTLLMLSRGHNCYMDSLRNELISGSSNIIIQDIDNLNAETFNRCEQEQSVMVTVDLWQQAYPFLKSIAVDWNCRIPYGILYAERPPLKIRKLLACMRGMSAPYPAE